jgi:hypothetical protein
MTDDPLMNDDDIYAEDIEIDERIDSKPLATYHHKMLLVSPESDVVPVDRDLLVLLALLVYDMSLTELMEAGLSIADVNILQADCEQILREHGE